MNTYAVSALNNLYHSYYIADVYDILNFIYLPAIITAVIFIVAILTYPFMENIKVSVLSKIAIVILSIIILASVAGGILTPTGNTARNYADIIYGQGTGKMFVPEMLHYN